MARSIGWVSPLPSVASVPFDYGNNIRGQAIAAGVGDSTTYIYIERAISTDTIIAGDEEDEDEGGEI